MQSCLDKDKWENLVQAGYGGNYQRILDEMTKSINTAKSMNNKKLVSKLSYDIDLIKQLQTERSSR